MSPFVSEEYSGFPPHPCERLELPLNTLSTGCQGCCQSAPRRTQTFNPVIKGRSDGVSESIGNIAHTLVYQDLVDWIRTGLELPQGVKIGSNWHPPDTNRS